MQDFELADEDYLPASSSEEIDAILSQKGMRLSENSLFLYFIYLFKLPISIF